MKIFVSGGAKSGKTSLAQDLTVALAAGGIRYYVATLVPVDEEDRERIRRHILDREGMGFETLECGRDIGACLNKADLSGAFLVDSVTALLQNAMFPPEKNYQMDLDAARACGQELTEFVQKVANAVVVSDYIYSDAQRYEESTRSYRRCLAQIDRDLAKICDVVLEVSSGMVTVHKGEMPI